MGTHPDTESLLSLMGSLIVWGSHAERRCLHSRWPRVDRAAHARVLPLCPVPIWRADWAAHHIAQTCIQHGHQAGTAHLCSVQVACAGHKLS